VYRNYYKWWVRDLDEVKFLGFGYFASCVLVAHGYIHAAK
jgi:hypothetical protein